MVDEQHLSILNFKFLSFYSFIPMWCRILLDQLFLRLTFPTVTSTTTPLQVLPQFVEVLGKKIDKINTELDRLTVKLTFVLYCVSTKTFLIIKTPLPQDRIVNVDTTASKGFLGSI